MNIVKQLNAFNRLQIQNPLTTGQLALWYALLDVNNSCGWKEWFDVAMLRLELFTGMSRQGINKARKVLQDRGFIDYKTNEREATSYRLHCLYEENAFQEVFNALPQSATVPSQKSISLPQGVTVLSPESISVPKQKEITSSLESITLPPQKEIAFLSESIALPPQKEIEPSPEVQQRTIQDSREEIPVSVKEHTGYQRVTNQEQYNSPLYKRNESKQNQIKQNNSSQQISDEQKEWQSVLAYYKEQQLPSLSDAQKRILQKWTQSSGSELVFEAIDKTALHGKGLAYLIGILQRWKEEGMMTVQDVMMEQKLGHQPVSTQKRYVETVPSWILKQQQQEQQGMKGVSR